MFVCLTFLALFCILILSLSKLFCMIQSSIKNKHQVSTPLLAAQCTSILGSYDISAQSHVRFRIDLLFQIGYLYQRFTFNKSMGQFLHTLLIVCGNVLLAANTVRWLFVEMPCVHHGQPCDSWLMLHASSNHQTSLNVYYHPFRGD